MAGSGCSVGGEMCDPEGRTNVLKGKLTLALYVHTAHVLHVQFTIIATLEMETH